MWRMGESLRRLVPLPREESLRLLESVTYGRIVFSQHALPAITPVAHLVDAGTIVTRSQGTPPVITVTPGRAETVVAFEADAIDGATHLGWGVAVVGAARLILDPGEQALYRARLRRWADAPGDQLIRITPELVTGFRLVDGATMDAVPT